MDLSDHELELMAVDIGSAITAIVRKTERTGQDQGVDEHRQLLGRVLEEQLKRRRASA
jgi:hypothetical protein